MSGVGLYASSPFDQPGLHETVHHQGQQGIGSVALSHTVAELAENGEVEAGIVQFETLTARTTPPMPEQHTERDPRRQAAHLHPVGWSSPTASRS
ncbi:hypothetical protein [Streptomyces sp. DASNCL29]|uniref:hypothetical protein n=1 Tax=Streptomyces sp. DASNCL29 TaxID=2583819 RepID=UPI00110FBCF1|nr:hypothetical protein [Streptomyces sp. DASNCL29]TMU98276.1 hypothetical protein FGK60_10810 [Streptomyces sp. DASNCL29]